MVGAGDFFDPTLFPWIPELQGNWEQIRDEATAVMTWRAALPAFQEISEEVGYITQDRDWKTLLLKGYGIRSRDNECRCPNTARLVNAVPDIRTAFFSILEPGKRLPLHRGPFNGVLRMHLGLVVPEPPEHCWIRVGKETRHWSPGEVLVFDDSHMHEVHNNTDQTRVVLFVDFIRPCRGLTGLLTRGLLALARFSPLVQKARRAQRRWEQNHPLQDRRRNNRFLSRRHSD